MNCIALGREAKYNILRNDYATQALELNHPTELPYPGSWAVLQINGEWITRNYEQKLNKAVTELVIR